MAVSIIIPCYNERDYIDLVISRVSACGVDIHEIIVVDDFSTDGTRELLQKYHNNPIYKIIYHEQNKGKGAALQTGISKVTGEVVIIQDADLEYDPKEYKKLLSPIQEGKADVVYGSRFMGSEPHRVLYFSHRFANAILTFISNLCTNLNLTDMETCHKVIKFDILNKIEIEESGFGVEPELTAKLAKLKVRFYEVGISYNGRTYEEGKKIGYKDALRALIAIIKYNLFR